MRVKDPKKFVEEVKDEQEMLLLAANKQEANTQAKC